MLTLDASMKNLSGFWVDLSKYKFDDSSGSMTSWIQAFPLGSWDHPIWGPIVITPERVKNFADNVNTGVRDQQLDIDYDHKDYGGKAAGWVKLAEARPDGLWLLIEWTPDARTALSKKEYRYFSPEFADEWTHPGNGKTFTDVLFGGALTNRPFIKDILPINLAEVVSNNGGNVDETTKALISALLPGQDPEKVTSEQLVEAVTKLTTTPPAPKPEVKPEDKPEEKPELVTAGALSEAAITKLLADHPEVKALREKVGILETASRLSEVDLQLKSLNEGGKFAVPPAAIDKIREVLITMPKDKGDVVVKAFADLVKTGLVPLSEIGGQTAHDEGDSPSKKLSELIDVAMKANDKLTYVDAVEAVGKQHPDLYAAYRREASQKD